MAPRFRDRHLLVTVAAAVAIVDQLTKRVVVALIGPERAGHSLDIVGSWLRLEYAENRGIAFGLFPMLGAIVPFLTVAIVAFLLLRHLRARPAARWEALATAAICGGAAGNLIDRLRLGYVVDFVSVGAWPNFNVADSAITIGATALIWGWIRETDSRELASDG